MIRIMISCLAMNGVFALYNFFGPGWVAYGRIVCLLQLAVVGISGIVVYVLVSDMMKLPKSVFHISLKGMCNRLLRRGAR